jgi:hypothetical protein
MSELLESDFIRMMTIGSKMASITSSFAESSSCRATVCQTQFSHKAQHCVQSHKSAPLYQQLWTLFLAAFKLQKCTYTLASPCLSLPAYNNSRTAKHILMKFDTEEFYWLYKFVKTYQFRLKSDSNNRHFTSGPTCISAHTNDLETVKGEGESPVRHFTHATTWWNPTWWQHHPTIHMPDIPPMQMSLTPENSDIIDIIDIVHKGHVLVEWTASCTYLYYWENIHELEIYRQ